MAEILIWTVSFTTVAALVVIWIFRSSDVELREREAELRRRCEMLNVEPILAKFAEANRERAEAFDRYANELLATPLPDEPEERTSESVTQLRDEVTE